MEFMTKTVSLAYPIKIEGRTIREITFREPDIEMLEQIEELGVTEGQRPTIRQLKGLFVALGDQPAEIVGKVHRNDLVVLSEAAVPFLVAEEKAEA